MNRPEPMPIATCGSGCGASPKCHRRIGEAQLVAGEGVEGGELGGNLAGQGDVDAALDVQRGQLGVGHRCQFAALAVQVGVLAGAWEETDTYSPAAMAIAPAAKAARPAASTALRGAWAAATPNIKLALDALPSSAPSAEARSHPARWAR